MKILVIEDDKFLSELISGKLAHEHFEVFTAINGEDAVTTANKEIPDLVVLDLMLPKVDGLSALEKIRTNEALKATPVIVFSNVTEEEDISRAKALGVHDYMIKANFTLDELIERIKTLLPSKTA